MTGRNLRFFQAVWIVLVLVSLGMTAVGVPAYFYQLSHPPGGVLHDLHHLGIPVAAYAVYLTALTAAADLVGLAVAGMVAWRRFGETIGLVTSLFLVLIVAGSPTNSTPVSQVFPRLLGIANVVSFLFLLFMVIFLMTFPDGQVVPRRLSRPFWVAVVVYALLFVVTGQYAVASQDSWMNVPLLLAFLFGLGSQIYRFRRVSGPAERQQIKLVLLALTVAILCSIPFAFLPMPSIGPNGTPYDAVSVTVLLTAFVLIPVSIGVAVLRYRLWDADVLINRALVYGSLTVTTVAIYVGGVIGLQALSRGLVGQHSDLAVAIVTLAVAALFNPWRHRLQHFIDHRFYRRKYDAARVLTAFTAHLRDEVDLEQLSGDLAMVLQETVQPASISLWLKKREGDPA
jgi:hypothetical protein